MKKLVCLIIRDGWGLSERVQGNAVLAAKTPNMDKYKSEYPWSRLEASGEAVGLPAGFMGSSEVGHLNMGAGRVVEQELKRIDEKLQSGEFFRSEVWEGAMKQWKERGGQLHFLGLLQDEGVHAHMDQLFKLMQRAREENPEGEMVIHPFLDGRDTPPRSAAEFLEKLEKVMEEVGNVKIGTVMGRYYGMDRGKRWELTDRAYACLVGGMGERVESVEEVIGQGYGEQAPDGSEMTDEYIRPHVLGGYGGMQEGDVVIHTNYRQDRAIQLTQAFVSEDYLGERERVEVMYVGMTQYYDEFKNYLLGSMGEGGGVENLLGEVVSDAGMRQLRIAETQKIRHVTSFFNGKSLKPYKGEEDVEIPSRFDPSSFALHPEMEAYNVVDELLKRLEEGYELVVVNFANCDMVGHTGNFDAAVRAVEVVDDCMGKVVEKVLELEGEVLITADHGNAEEMLDPETGKVKTSHTTNLVELVWVSERAWGKKLADGKLGDIAPTILHLLEIEKPSEMTGEDLICE